MKNLKLRKADDSDSEFAYLTKKAAFRQYVEQVWGWDEKQQRGLHAGRFSSQEFRIIELSGIDVGVIALVREPDCLKLSQIFLLPEFQGKGIGTACTTRAIEDAAASGIPVRLKVLKVNIRAITFFQRLGFNSMGQTDTHILMERAP